MTVTATVTTTALVLLLPLCPPASRPKAHCLKPIVVQIRFGAIPIQAGHPAPRSVGSGRTGAPYRDDLLHLAPASMVSRARTYSQVAESSERKGK